MHPGQDGAPGDREEVSAQHARDPGPPAEDILIELKLLLEGRIQFLEVLKVSGSPVLGPICCLVRGSKPLFIVSSMTLPRLGCPSTG
jgi:hypothetical protein